MNTWIFSLAKTITAPQQQALAQDFKRFLAQWHTHGKAVAGEIFLAHDRFVVVRLAPEAVRPSGCSIDSMRQAVSRILMEHQCDVLDASHVFFRDLDGAIRYEKHHQLPALISHGTLQADSMVFDHSLGGRDQLDHWEVPLHQSWMKRYLPQ